MDMIGQPPRRSISEMFWDDSAPFEHRPLRRKDLTWGTSDERCDRHEAGSLFRLISPLLRKSRSCDLKTSAEQAIEQPPRMPPQPLLMAMRLDSCYDVATS